MPRADYGFDAPYVPIGFGLGALAGAAFAVSGAVNGSASRMWSGVIYAVMFALSAASYVWTTRRGKLVVWGELLAELTLRGDEQVLDVGCGRGAVLIAAAARVSSGRATGIDLWSTSDQSGNAEATTRRNAELEGVGARIELMTGDMRTLPFADASFDVVTSSLAIHNVRDADGRAQAIDEIARVLRPGGVALIVDFRHTAAYAARFSTRALDVTRRRLGWRFWFGGPHAAASLVVARKPA